MNIVFWLIVVIVLVLIWFCLSFAFKGVGGVGMRLYNDAKKEISEETEKKTDEELVQPRQSWYREIVVSLPESLSACQILSTLASQKIS